MKDVFLGATLGLQTAALHVLMPREKKSKVQPQKKPSISWLQCIRSTLKHNSRGLDFFYFFFMSESQLTDEQAKRSQSAVLRGHLSKHSVLPAGTE